MKNNISIVTNNLKTLNFTTNVRMVVEVEQGKLDGDLDRHKQWGTLGYVLLINLKYLDTRDNLYLRQLIPH